MTLESLLLSQDPELVRVVRPTLEQLSIEVEICHEAQAATELLVAQKYDAIIVDCDDLRGGLEVLQGLRSTPSNKNSAVFAILNGTGITTQDAFSMGANFVLQKPISNLNASRCFHAALNFMVRERRRYFRHPVSMPIQILVGDKTVEAISSNISESGIALTSREALPKAAIPRLQLTLPGTDRKMSLEAEVVWADIRGRAGLRFRNVAEDSQAYLEKWLNERLEEKHPGTKDLIAESRLVQ
jgi:DNA-binding response OmpR family regulator